MDATAKPSAVKPLSSKSFVRPSRQEAEEAVRTLIAWAGDDPTREGLLSNVAHDRRPKSGRRPLFGRPCRCAG